MDIRKVLNMACVAALLAAGHSTAGAAVNLPPALAKEGRVCATWESSADGGHVHALKKWKLKAGESRLAIHGRLSGSKYIDVLGSWPNELQDADLLIINKASNPVQSREEDSDGCSRDVEPIAFTPQQNIPDFVFGFAVRQIKNAAGEIEKQSPHAIVYLPINTGHEPASSAQEFQILLFHMNRAVGDCPSSVGEERDQCIALSELRSMWERGGYSTIELEQAAAARIRRILKVGTSVPGAGASLPLDAYTTYFLKFTLYHNGVIHGTF